MKRKIFFGVVLLLISLRCMDGAPAYVGYVDIAGCNGIVGWAADTARLNVSIVVSLYDVSTTLTGTLLTSTVASVVRPDVGAALKDSGLHGFSFPVPQDGASHMLALRFESSTVTLSSSPRTLQCGRPPTSAIVVREALSGTLDGINVTFTLSTLPNPAFPFLVFRNGLLLTQCFSTTNCNGDYRTSGTSISFLSGAQTQSGVGAIPRAGDLLNAVYWK